MISQIHDKAMTKLELAKKALANRQPKTYRVLLSEALALEKEAAHALLNDFDCEPTRSVLFRSAASIAFEAENYDDAIILATKGLNGQPFIEIKNELEDLLHQAKSQITESLSILNDEGDVLNASKDMKLSEDAINEYLLAAVKACTNNEGWAALGEIGNYLIANTPIDYRHFGFFSLQKFILSRGIFDIHSFSESLDQEDTGNVFVKLKE